MKPNYQFAVYIAAMGCSVLSATATTYQWDVNGSTSGLGGAGTWNTTNVFWDLFGTGTDDGTDATSAVTFTSADTAKFGGTAATVTLGTPTTVNGLSFDVDGYTLTGSTLTLAGTTPGIGVTTGNATVSSVVAGTSGFTKTGAGMLTLSGQNTFSGTTTINGGSLKLAMGEQYGSSRVGSAVEINSSGILLLNTNFGTGFTTNGPADITINAGGSLNKNGYATYIKNLTMNGTGTVIGGGSLQLCSNLAATSTAAGAPSISSLNLVGGSYTSFGNAHTIDVTHGAGSTSTIDLTIGGIGQITDGASPSMIKSGDGTLAITAASSYAGGTTIRAGTLIANAANALGTSGTVTLNDASTGTSNTTLLIKGENTLANNIVVASQGSGTVTLGGTAIKVSSTFATATYSGTIALNRDVTLYNGDSTSDRLIFSNVISGNGHITVDGVSNSRVSFVQGSNNTFVGNVNVTGAGRLQLGAGGGAADLIYDGAVLTVASGGQFVMAKGGQNETIGALSGAGSVFAAWGNDTLTVGGNNQGGTFSGTISQSGATLALIKTGSGTQTLSGANTYSGGTTIQNGTLVLTGGANRLSSSGSVVLGGSSTSGKLVLGDSSAAISQTLTGLTTTGNGGSVVGGNSSVSTLNLNIASGDNAFGGVLGGSGTNENNLALTKSGNGTLTLSGGGTVANLQPDAGTVAISGGTYTVTNAFSHSDWGTARASTVNQTGGTVTLGSGANYYGARSSNQALNYNLSAGTFDASAGSFWLAWDGGSNPVFNVSGTGLLKVAGLNQANTGTTGGTLNLTGGQITIGSGGIGNNKFVFNTLNFGGGTIASSAAFSGNAGQAITLTGTNGATTFNTTGGNITLNGALGGAGGLTKSGTGTISLTAANTYAGTTTINGGTLALSGSGALASPAIIVGASTTFDVSGVTGGYTSGAGQTISGTGTIVGNITIGGTLAPGNSPGDLGFADNLGLTSTLNLEIAGVTSGLFDRLVGDGANTLTLGGVLNLNNTGYSPAINDTITVFSNWLSITGSFTTITGTDLGGGLSWDTSQLATNGILTVVPEPRAALLGGIGLFMLLRRRRVR